MIELPESRTLAAQIGQSFIGQAVMHAEADHSPHGFASYFGDPKTYGIQLQGRTLDGVSAFGGYVQLQFGDLRLCLFDGVNARYLGTDGKQPEKHQLFMTFANGAALYCTISMYGGILLFSEGQNKDNFYYTAAQTKPSPLDEAFTEQYFQTILAAAKPTLSTKALLATEQRIPGLGNGVLHDILYVAGIHPKRKIATLNDADLSALYSSIKSTLRKMTEQGGRNTEKDFFGKPGGYETCLSSRTLKRPCPRCASAIVRQAYLGGNVYFCPVCQPLP